MKRRLFLILLCTVLALLPVLSLASSYWRVDTTWLKAREKPSYKAQVLDSYRRDFAVEILDVYSGGWAKVRFLPAGHVAYVQAGYLEEASSSYTAWIVLDGTQVRIGPAKSFKSKGYLNTGAKVTVLTHGATYDYVSTSKGKGYVLNNRLSTSKPSIKSAVVKNKGRRTVNLRTGPGTDYDVIAEYRPGTKVTVIDYGSKWCEVVVKGEWGYMMTKYLSF
jgi:uncharacterized protein YgiM (DUF1202 family)